jgi:hypothetical protein
MRFILSGILYFCAIGILLCAGVAQADVFNDAFDTNLNQISDVSSYEPVENPQRTLPIYIGILAGWTGFMGINMMIHIVLGAYEYMTAHDNAEKVLTAKKRIRNVIYAALILISGYILVAALFGIFGGITGYGG